MNIKRTLATLISASLLTLSAVPMALAGDPQPAVKPATDNAAAAMHEPDSKLEQAANKAQDAVSDNSIQGKLEASFMADEHLSSFAIDTRVIDGVATLTGSVDSEADRDLATRVAMSIKGITTVQNSLVVKAAESISKS